MAATAQAAVARAASLVSAGGIEITPDQRQAARVPIMKQLKKQNRTESDSYIDQLVERFVAFKQIRGMDGVADARCHLATLESVKIEEKTTASLSKVVYTVPKHQSGGPPSECPPE